MLHKGLHDPATLQSHPPSLPSSASATLPFLILEMSDTHCAESSVPRIMPGTGDTQRIAIKLIN